MKETDLVCVDSIFKRNASSFINSIKNEVKIGSRRIRLEKPVFPVFGIENPEFFEQWHFENEINRRICDYLINDNIFDLFSMREQIDDSVKLIRAEEKSNEFGHPGICKSKPVPFAFTLDKGDIRVGYRYTYPNKMPDEIKKLIQQYRLHHIEIIDWSEEGSTGNKNEEKDTNIQTISFHEFILQFFSDDVYSMYINSVKAAIQEVRRLIGYQTISKLSPRHLWDFKRKKLKEIKEYYGVFNQLQYTKFSESGELTDSKYPLLSKEDYKVLEERFFSRSLYKFVNSNEPFARCFMTSEYLYETLKAGGEKFFDYSSIVTGYFKSVELLLYKIMDATLQMKGHEQLWITCTKRPSQPDSDYEMKNRFWHVRFKSEHKNVFKTEMGSLVDFIEHNQIGWHLSQQGIHQVVNCLKNYNQGCRNQHLHKDLIEDTPPVEKIRDNTLLCMYYLIGGCKFADNEKDEEQVLGLVDDTYDRLFNELKNISGVTEYYYLKMNNSLQEIKTVRLAYNESFESDQFDCYGNIITPIRFIKVAEFSDYKFRTEEEYRSFIKANQNTDNEIILSRDNIPQKIWWYNSYRGRVEVVW